MCRNTIRTDPLGSCLFFLVRCLFRETRICLLYHHDFNNYDDSGKPQLIILKQFLVMIFNRLKKYLKIPSLIPNRPPGNPGVKECLLAIGGGEIHEAERIKRSFSFLLNHNKKANKNICFNEPDHDYLYKQLFNYTVNAFLSLSLSTYFYFSDIFSLYIYVCM